MSAMQCASFTLMCCKLPIILFIAATSDSENCFLLYRWFYNWTSCQSVLRKRHEQSSTRFLFILSLLDRLSLRSRYLQYIFMCTVFRFSLFWACPPPSHLFCIYFCSHCCIVSPSSHILVVTVLVSIKTAATTNYADT